MEPNSTKLVVVVERESERPWAVGPFDTEELARAAEAELVEPGTSTYVVQLIEPDPELKYLWP